ncbi:MAG TPA: serine/threonine-protein kinase [Planctomycetota bacterium]|jgi:serine/threonine-protein kinase
MAELEKKVVAPPAGEAGSFGNVALKLGFITKVQLEEAMRVQAAAAKAGLRKKLGEILLRKGYLTNEQLDKVVKGQTVTGGRKRVGDYELLSKLGEGGMGAVYRAKQLSMDRVVALKILAPRMAKNKEFRDRFLREARAVAKLNHEHIVAGIDVGQADGFWYFAMEFVDGESLGQRLTRQGGKLEEEEALRYVRQIALALQHAHENKLLHRDVKPDNVLLDKGGRIAKLADLGLARESDANPDDVALTQAGQAVGTPFYISPEQARGLHNLSPATDLYSLGATLFHLLTGQVPFDGPTAAVIMTRHLTDPVPSIRGINPEISAGAEEIVLRLMEKEPEARYPDCKALIKDIDRVLDGDTQQRKGKAKTKVPVMAEREAFSSTPPMPARQIRRRRQSSETGLGVILVLVILAAAVFVFMNSGPRKPPRPEPKPAKQVQKTPVPTAVPTPAPPPEQPKPAPVANTDPATPPATPAVLETAADGTKSFKADFENNKFTHFEIDPAVGKAGQGLRVIADAAGNHVLRLGQIRSTSFLAKDSGAMVRLVLPKDFPFSKTASFSFMVHFEKYADPNPEVRIWWDHKVEGEPRSVSGWVLKDPTFSSGWGKVNVVLNKAQTKLPTREHYESPPYIAIYAGKPDETLDVFIDDIEFVNAAEGKATSKTSTETPVAPPPKKKDTEPPVAPPPKKAGDATAPAKKPTEPGSFGGAL